MVLMALRLVKPENESELDENSSGAHSIGK